MSALHTEAAVPVGDGQMLALIETVAGCYELGPGNTYFTADAVVRDGCDLANLMRLANDFMEATVVATASLVDIEIPAGGRRLILRAEVDQ